MDRPRSQWITYEDERLRAVSDELFARAQSRLRPIDGRREMKNGGKPKYLLSGLLRCATCGARYIGVNGTEYGCSSHRDGNACSNGVRVKRTRIEEVLVSRLRRDLLAPETIKVIAQDMHVYFEEQSRARQLTAAETPRELQELDARLRQRLKLGDPDMATDELQAAVDRAEAKRRELVEQQPAVKQSAKVLRMLPKAAELARREIAAALSGDSRASMKARVILRGLYEGGVQMVPDANGGLTAHWNLQAAALVRGAVGSNGSGGRI